MRILPYLTALVACFVAAVAAAETLDPAKQYRDCIGLARDDPQNGWQQALAWSSLGGGEPARHCATVAMIGLRQFEEAAKKLEEIAAGSTSPAKLRAGMLAQAGQARLLARQPDQAIADQSKALELVPGAPDLLVDRAQSWAEQKNYAAALADLDAAIGASPERADALTFRAAAKRHLDDLAGARSDIAKALALSPNDQDAWLEDGALKRFADDQDGARQSWDKVLQLAPQSEAAETARRDLELLDAPSQDSVEHLQ